jgi:hypothetical protein
MEEYSINKTETLVHKVDTAHEEPTASRRRPISNNSVYETSSAIQAQVRPASKVSD